MKIKLFEFWHKKDNQRDQAILITYNMSESTATHLIALARLMFVKPETLAREAKNIKANAEYILKMTESQKEKP